MNHISNIESLLGKEFHDPLMQEAIKYFELPAKRPKIPKGDLDIGIQSISKGLDVNFTLIEHIDFLDQSNFPEGALIATAIFLYRQGVDGHDQYKDCMPHDVAFNMTRDQVKSVLGEPSWRSPMLPIDRWVFGKYKVVIDFSENEKLIDTVTLQLLSE